MSNFIFTVFGIWVYFGGVWMWVDRGSGTVVACLWPVHLGRALADYANSHYQSVMSEHSSRLQEDAKRYAENSRVEQ